MNKFRDNLHSALFSLDGGKPSQDFYDSGIDRRLEVETDTKRELDGLVAEIIEDPDFSNVITEVVNDKRGTENFEENQNRFNQRLESQDSQGKKYAEVWNARIKEGYAELISRLQKNDNFTKLEEGEKKSTLKSLAGLYLNEVKSQYSKNVWNADDATFNKVKDIIFTDKSSEYPVTKVIDGLFKKDEAPSDQKKLKEMKESNRRSYEQRVDISEENMGANLEAVGKRKFGDKKDFLSEDLPNYFYKIQKLGVGKKILKFLGIKDFNDRTSEEDKKAIKNFLKVVNDITDEGGMNHENALKTLMNLLRDSNLTVNSNKSDYEKAIKDNNVNGDVDVEDIMEVGKMYLKTRQQGNEVREQHNIYYGIIQCLDKQGIDRTIAMFKNEVEEYKKNGEISNEKAGEELKEKDEVLFNISNRFTKDYASALRLANMETSNFQNKLVVDILADLDNNGHVRLNDKGVTKTGQQFEQIVKIYGEDKVLKDLFDQAKIANNMMNLGLGDEDFNKEQIQQGNKKLILLLQSIISQPGGDFATMIGLDDKKLKELEGKAPKGPEDSEVQEATAELIKTVNLEGLKDIEGIGEVATEAGLRQAVAGAMYTEYMKGVGVGVTIPFKEWAKGLSLNVGLQAGKKGYSLGLALAYSKEFDLGNGRSVTPGASIGFIGILKNNGEKIPGFGGTLDVNVAKQRVEDNGIQHRIGVTVGGIVAVKEWTPQFGAFLGVNWDQDKLGGIEIARNRMEAACHDEFMAPLMKSISDALGDNKVLNLDDSEVVSVVKQTIEGEIDKAISGKNLNIDKTTMVDNTIRFLSFYNNYDLSTEVIREVIAKGISKQCALARESNRLQSLDDDTYFSGVGVGVAYMGMLVGHVSFSWKKHQHDTFGDRYFMEHPLEMPDKFKAMTSRNQNMIDDFNKYLPDEEGKKLKLAEYGGVKFIVVPKALLSDVHVNSEMKGKMKKDADGNVLLHDQTYIDWPTLYVGTTSESVTIYVGGVSENMPKLSTCEDDWFTTEPINPETLPGRDFIVTSEILTLAIDDLRNKVPDDIKDRIKDYKFPESMMSRFEKNKKYTVVLRDDGNQITTEIKDEGKGRGVAIEYRGRKSVDLVSNEAQSIAKDVYEQANMVVSNELNNISHNPAHSLYSMYRNFATAVKDQRYDEAKNTMLRMLPLMDKAINKYQPRGKKVKFNKIAPTLQNLQGAELGKALMSINNIFARVKGVRGGVEGEYSFIYGQRPSAMGTIIESRSKGIKSTINRSSELPQDAKDAYNYLIDFTENYRKNVHPEKYQYKSKQTTTLNNAIGINLGNPISTENPLFNPEVYTDSIIDSGEINFSGKDILYNRMLNVIAGNKALISPILKALGFDENVNIDPSKITYENGKINIDINGKIVMLKADMKIAYYAQCVNHMLILDNIHAEIEGEGRSVDFGPSAGGDGALNEGTLEQVYSTESTKIGIAAAIFEGGSHSTPQVGGTPNDNIVQNDY